MATTKDYLDYILEQLVNIDGITYRKMMGEYLLYLNGVLFGGIYDNRFLIKITKGNEQFNLSKEIPYEGAKLMYLVDTEDRKFISTLIQNAVSDLSNIK